MGVNSKKLYGLRIINYAGVVVYQYPDAGCIPIFRFAGTQQQWVVDDIAFGGTQKKAKPKDWGYLRVWKNKKRFSSLWG